MLQSTYLTEYDLKDFGFKSLGVNVRISSDTRIYGAQNISIGDNVRIDDFTILSASTGHISLGNYVHITRGCHLSGTYGIEIHDFCCLAANSVIHSASDDYSGKSMTNQAVPDAFRSYHGGLVTLGKHVILGVGCVVIGPAHIGEGCSLGVMTAVLGKDLAPWGIYVGTPARRLKERQRDLLIQEEALKNNPSSVS